MHICIMKKISLSTVKNSMRRDELRAIKGGSACINRCVSAICYWYGMSAECGTSSAMVCYS